MTDNIDLEVKLAAQQRQIDLLLQSAKDLTTLYKSLYASLAALQNAVEAMGVRRN